MKLMKRALALLLCFLMLTNGPISAFATEGTDDVVVETTTTETVETCEECGGSGAHTETCSLNIVAPLTTETPDETTEPTTTPTEETTTPSTVVTEPTVTTGSAISTDPVGCTECNQTEGHLDTCSQYVAPTEETTEPTVSGNDVAACTECGATEGHTTECSQYVDPNACAECKQVDGHAETCSQYEAPAPTIAEQLLATESVEDMYMMVLDLMQNDPEALMALSADEIAALRERINELDPEGDDVDTQDLLDTLAILPNGGEELEGDPVILPASGNTTFSSNQTLNGVTLSGDAKWTINAGVTISLTGQINTNGHTLAIEGKNKDTSIIKATANITNWMFNVKSGQGGSLIMSNVTVDGGAIWSGAIDATVNRGATNSGKSNRIVYVNYQDSSDSAYEFKATNCIFRNASYPGSDGTGSPVFRFNSNADAYFENCTILNCENPGTSGAGVIYMPYSKDQEAGATERTFVMKNTEISGCKASYSSGGILRTNGTTLIEMTLDGLNMHDNYSGGWGNILWNAIGSCDITNSTFTHNTSAMRGGAISSEGLGMTITGCGFYNNHAGDYGGAIAMFPYTLVGKDAVTSGNELTMSVQIGEGCKFENNTAPKGGAVAIFIQKSDSAMSTTLNAEINLGNAGCMKNNTATTGGGAIYAGCTVADVNLASKLNLTINSGSIYNNTAPMGGAVLLDDVRVNNTGINTVTIAGGQIGGQDAPNTATYGAGVAVEKGNFFMTGGSISYNQASTYGGAAYISGGNATISGGEMVNNTAVDGAGIYISGGNITMSNGTISENIATGNGGAAYVAGGNVTIEHGTINGNKATGTTDTTGNGGAIYMSSETAILKMESGTMNSNEATNDGGAIYANGGKILIGLQDCSSEEAGADCSHHTNKGEGRHHPVINNNTAGDTGGGIAISKTGTTAGEVHFYCGTANENEARYKGVGMNVFMDGGTFNLYNAADVGKTHDPDLVIIGGTLVNMSENKDDITLNYYISNDSTQVAMTGIADYMEYMNLPAAEYYWPEYAEENNLVFIGWTAQGAVDSSYVRNKEHYIASGDPVQILDHQPNGDAPTDEDELKTYNNTMRMWDKNNDKVINLYAIWAPKTSKITYVNGLTGATISNTDTDPDNPATYDFNRESNVLQIQPVKNTGYDLVGWYIYQDADQNANWNETLQDTSYEPVATGEQPVYMELAARNGVLSLEAGNTNFGNITLIAKFEPAYTDLKITKTGWQTIDENQTFIFKITGNPNNENLDDIEMTVTIQGDGSVLIKELPVGDYTVTEITDWSWRYTPDKKTKEVQLVDSSKTEQVDFSNTRSKIYWLSGDSYCTNWWGDENGTVTKRKASN